MVEVDKDALYCDFVETYHIFDYESLPLYVAARLAYGLRDDSRIKMKMAGVKISLETSLLAAIADNLSILVWQNTENGHKNRNRPQSMLKLLTEKEDNKVVGYATPAEFERAWKAANEKD